MKLAKLSLAAIMTVGALTTVSAANLEDSIKGVDFSGMLRYRLNDTDRDAVENSSESDFDFLGKFVAPVTDNIKATLAFASSSDEGVNKTGDGINTLNVDLRKAFFTYTNAALTVKAGLQSLGTPVTDNGFNGTKGTGVVGMYNVGPVTMVGAYFTGSNYTSGAKFNLPAIDTEIAAIAAIGAFGPVNAQVWAMEAQGMIDNLIFAQVDGKFAGVTLLAQAISTTLDDKIVPVGDEDSGMFYAFKAGYAMDNFAVNAGYTDNDEDQGINSIAGGDSSGMVTAGWRLPYEIDNEADVSAFFIDAGMTFGKAGAKIGYASSSSDTDALDIDEIWGEVSYAVAKNLNTYVKYSDMQSEGTAVDQQYFRFEAKYSF